MRAKCAIYLSRGSRCLSRSVDLGRIASMRALEHLDDAELLADRTRPDESFSAFYRRNVETTLRYCASRGVSASDAADATAETFAAALVSRYAYGPERGVPSAWLLGILRHKLADQARRWTREGSMCRRLGMERLVPDRDDIAEYERWRQEDSAALRALSALSVEHSEAVRARVLQGERYSSIARRLGLTEQAARQRVSRALATLRILLKEER